MEKILVVHNRYNILGGEDISVEKELNLLKEIYKVETLYFNNKIDNFLTQSFAFLTNNNLKSNKLLRQKIEKFKPDHIYLHNTWFKASLGIFKIIKKYDINLIIKLHNFRYFCTKSIFSRNHLTENENCRACGMSASTGAFNKYFKESIIKSILVNIYGRKYFKIIKNNKLKLIVLTQFHKSYLINLGFDKNNIEVIPNYLSIPHIKKNMKKEDYIVYAGRISYEKGVEELINSFLKSNLNKINLKIIGEGPDLDYLTHKYKSDKVDFLGSVENEEVWSEILNSKAVVTATKLFEGQPTLLCEASLLEVPAIFPSTGGIGEFFPDSYPLSYEQFNYEDLIDKINLVSNVKEMNRIGKENYKYINKYLSKIKLASLFKEALHGK
jgi:glycosyltransferase involved in cell wall biosynthesis